MIKIGLDTSCLNVKASHSVLNELERLASSGKICLITSSVNEREQIDTNKNEYWRQKYLGKINQMKKIAEVGRFGVSHFGQAVFGDSRCTDLKKLFPKKKQYYDLWLLQTAMIGECDYFLTLNSKDFIENGIKEQLEIVGIKVRVPNHAFLEEILKI